MVVAMQCRAGDLQTVSRRQCHGKDACHFAFYIYQEGRRRKRRSRMIMWTVRMIVPMLLLRSMMMILTMTL